MKDRNHTDEVARLRESNCFSMEGRFTDEEHLAAFYGTPRKSIISELFRPADRAGVPHIQIGYHFACTLDALEAYFREHAIAFIPAKSVIRRRRGAGRPAGGRS